MRRIKITISANLAALGLLACLSAVSASAQKGMIISRTGDTMVVNGSEGKFTVVLTDGTDTRDLTGLFGLGREHLADTVLIPGLKVDVKGTKDAKGRVVAKTITVDGDDLETAEMIQSGLHPTAQQVADNVAALEAHHKAIAGNKQDIATNQQNIAANQQQIQANMKDIDDHTERFMALDDYDTKGQATVKFASGSAKVSAADQEQLKQLAQTATGVNGYIIEVTGYTDSKGSAAMNTKLSEARARAVIAVLMQQGNIPARRIVAPGAMGEYGSAAPNETSAGRAENRRVDVKVLVNKGIAGGL
jgi:OmpA-OmpF porin, OOP family